MLKKVLFAVVAVFGLYAQDPGQEPQLPRVAVMPLKASFSGQLVDQGDTINQMVTTAFHKLKRFELIERAQLQMVLGEGKFQGSGLVDDSSAVELGKQAGAKMVMVGSWTGNLNIQHGQTTNYKTGVTTPTTSYTGQIRVNIRMVDVQTGRIKYTFEATGQPLAAMSVGDATTSMLADVDKKFNRVVANEFPLAGIILKVISEKEFLMDVGKGDGVQKGDIFVAIKRGEDIIHPRTGARIPGEKTVLAELEVSRVDERTSVVRLSKNIAKLPFSVGMELEQKPKEASFWEKAGDMIRH
jgi:curli biogenesis system outer membrane secretion channel CsgG